ncbi:hypothetical protein PRIPAC_82660, partial [Pristionchus pacificus]
IMPRYLLPKPDWSIPNMVALALTNHGPQLAVAEIYDFICFAFPFYRTAPDNWKNSVRHTLSHGDAFEKIILDDDYSGRSKCLWRIRPEQLWKVEVAIWRNFEKDPSPFERQEDNEQLVQEMKQRLAESAINVVRTRPANLTKPTLKRPAYTDATERPVKYERESSYNSYSASPPSSSNGQENYDYLRGELL